MAARRGGLVIIRMKDLELIKLMTLVFFIIIIYFGLNMVTEMFYVQELFMTVKLSISKEIFKK